MDPALIMIIVTCSFFQTENSTSHCLWKKKGSITSAGRILSHWMKLRLGKKQERNLVRDSYYIYFNAILFAQTLEYIIRH